MNEKLSLEYTTENGESAAMCSEGNEHYVTQRIKNLRDRNMELTPKEQLYEKLFIGYSTRVSEMQDLEMEAFREELSKIAFEARVGVGAVDAEKDRRKKSKNPSNFTKSVNGDSDTEGAINSIKLRRAAMSKEEKKHQDLIDKMTKNTGITVAMAEEILSKGNILKMMREKGDTSPVSAEKFVNTPEQELAVAAAKAAENIENGIKPAKQVSTSIDNELDSATNKTETVTENKPKFNLFKKS